MPLLDGRYEIHTESPSPGGGSIFRATAPSGEVVRVAWYDIRGEQESAFEGYRRLIKRLLREGQAAVLDVVSRPGAHYVVWRLPPEGAAELPGDEPLGALIREAGVDPSGARRFATADGAKLFELPFRPAGSAAPAPSPSPPPAIKQRLQRWSGRLNSVEAKTWSLSLLLLASALVAFSAAFALQSNNAVVVLPDVVGLPYASAAAALSEQGLRVRPVPVARDDVGSGAVIATVPSAGTPLRPGREVLLRVALPTGELTPRTVPRLVGLTSAEAAIAALERADLRVGSVVALHLDTPAGVVVAQSPAASEVVGERSLVHLVVSRGPQPVLTFLPELVGLSSAEALDLAALAGLSPRQVVLESVPSAAHPEGAVVAQSLAPYRDFNRDSATLRLVVARSPHLGAASGAAGGALHRSGLPALGGMSESEAREVAVGFEVRVNTVADLNLPDGVIGQSLPVGATPSDGPLFLTVNARPVRIPRPEPVVLVRPLGERELSYLWFIEPGIPEVVAVVYATTLEGERLEVATTSARGGGRVEGVWRTEYRGVVRFDLELNGTPYGTPLRTQ